MDAFKTVNLTGRSAENGPEDMDQPVICQTRSKKITVFRDTWTRIQGQPEPVSNWEWLCDKYDIEWWTYQKEIII